jgi:hypothetical protein
LLGMFLYAPPTYRSVLPRDLGITPWVTLALGITESGGPGGGALVVIPGSLSMAWARGLPGCLPPLCRLGGWLHWLAPAMPVITTGACVPGLGIRMPQRTVRFRGDDLPQQAAGRLWPIHDSCLPLEIKRGLWGGTQSPTHRRRGRCSVSCGGSSPACMLAKSHTTKPQEPQEPQRVYDTFWHLSHARRAYHNESCTVRLAIPRCMATRCCDHRSP